MAPSPPNPRPSPPAPAQFSNSVQPPSRNGVTATRHDDGVLQRTDVASQQDAVLGGRGRDNLLVGIVSAVRHVEACV